MNFETNCIPAISTAHLTPTAKQWLEDFSHSPCVIVAKYEYGYFIWLSAEHENLPVCLSDISKWAHSHDELKDDMGLGWVRIDADCDTVDGLPVYDDLGNMVCDEEDANRNHCEACHIQLEEDRVGLCDDCNI